LTKGEKVRKQMARCCVNAHLVEPWVIVDTRKEKGEGRNNGHLENLEKEVP